MSSTHLEDLISTLVTFEEQGLDEESMDRPEQRGEAKVGTCWPLRSAHTPRQGDEMCGFNPVELNQDRIYPAGRQPPDFNTTFI